jgi:(E)-4-hydroxy-3-methylbut-2-enyl-diphosphate synthase
MATRRIKIGDLEIGGKNPILVQSMCNTPTQNVKATVAQIKKLERAGCEIIRVAVPNQKSAEALSKIKAQINIPLVADIHFDYRLALSAIDNGADKIRINPGNIGGAKEIKKVVQKAKEKKIPIRVGVNAGSLELKFLKKYGGPTPQALVASALDKIKILERENFKNIVVSLKSNNVTTTIKAHQLIAKKIDYPIHLGVTEAGTFLSGTVKSAIALGALLPKKIGATIRISLSDDPVKEIEVGWKILEALNLRRRFPEIISCPTCARACIDVIKIAKSLERKIKGIKKPIKIAIMGCLVNGPGEAREADIGICGINKKSQAVMLFLKGELIGKIKQKEALKRVMEEIKKM